MTQNQKVYLYTKHSDGHWGLFWSFDAKCLFIEYYAYEPQYRECLYIISIISFFHKKRSLLLARYEVHSVRF